MCFAYVLLRVKSNNRKSQITLVIYLDRLMDLFRLTALYLRTSLDEYGARELRSCRRWAHCTQVLAGNPDSFNRRENA